MYSLTYVDLVRVFVCVCVVCISAVSIKIAFMPFNSVFITYAAAVQAPCEPLLPNNVYAPRRTFTALYDNAIHIHPRTMAAVRACLHA